MKMRFAACFAAAARTAGLAALVMALAATAGLSWMGQQAESPVACTFSHPQYSGKCVEHVTPKPKQTPVQACRVVLDCLNDARCVKTYCQATTIRGGWTLESPKDPQKATSAAPPRR